MTIATAADAQYAPFRTIFRGKRRQAVVVLANEREKIVQTEDNKDLVRRFLEGPVAQALQGDAEVVRSYLTPDFIFHSPVVSSDGHHHDRLVQEGSVFGGMLPNHGVIVDHIFAEDDMVAAHFTFTSPEDTEIGAQGIAHYRLREGKISEIWYYSTAGETLRSVAS